MIIFAISFVLRQFQELKAVQYAFQGIRAGVMALLCTALWGMYKKNKKNWASYTVMAGSFILTGIFDVSVLPVLAGCAAGVIAHMIACVILLLVFSMDSAAFATILPKSITTAIGKSLSAELGGNSAITMATIMLTGQFGAVASPTLLKWFGVKHPLAQGLAIGTASHAAGTSRAVELGDVQGASSSLAIVVTGLLTVIAAPVMMLLANALFW